NQARSLHQHRSVHLLSGALVRVFELEPVLWRARALSWGKTSFRIAFCQFCFGVAARLVFIPSGSACVLPSLCCLAGICQFLLMGVLPYLGNLRRSPAGWLALEIADSGAGAAGLRRPGGDLWSM